MPRYTYKFAIDSLNLLQLTTSSNAAGVAENMCVQRRRSHFD